MLFPYFHHMGIFEGQMKAAGSKNVSAVSLSRSSWAGSQLLPAQCGAEIFCMCCYFSIAQSADSGYSANWDSMKTMISAGQSMAMSGQGWWTANSANISDPEYQELFVRWLFGGCSGRYLNIIFPVLIMSTWPAIIHSRDSLDKLGFSFVS